jgi:hypothetical protein
LIFMPPPPANTVAPMQILLQETPVNNSLGAEFLRSRRAKNSLRGTQTRNR